MMISTGYLFKFCLRASTKYRVAVSDEPWIKTFSLLSDPSPIIGYACLNSKFSVDADVWLRFFVDA